MTKIAHAWIREVRFDTKTNQIGSLIRTTSEHRVGCIVAERVSPTKARIAFSLCSPADKMDVKKAKRLALRRLTEFKSKATVIDTVGIGEKQWGEILNIDNVLDNHIMKFHRIYAEDRNQDAIMGLISEVCPQ